MINTRGIAAEYREKHWAEVMKEQQESGLSKKVYCEKMSIPPNVFYYWQRKLRETMCQEIMENQKNETKGEIIPIGWSACEVIKTAETREEKAKAIYVEIGRYRVQVTKGADQELLSDVCRTLQSL